MADTLTLLEGGAEVGAGIAKTGDTVFVALFIMLLVVIVGGLFFLVWWLTSFKYRVKIKESIGDGKFVVYEDLAKRIKYRGAYFWKLRRRKCRISPPPSEALQVTSRGRYYAECVHSEKSGLDAGYNWIIPKQDGSFKVNVTQEERALLADRVDRANSRKSLRTIDYIMQMAGIGMCVVIVVVVLAFYGDISENVNNSAREVKGLLQESRAITAEQVKLQEQINIGLAIVSGEEASPSSPQDIPLDQQGGLS